MVYKFSELADQDLQAIAYYIALDNETAALRVVEKILETSQVVADTPSVGRKPVFIEGGDTYCINVQKYDKYLLVYEPRDYGVEILRVLHGARDLPTLFSNQAL